MIIGLLNLYDGLILSTHVFVFADCCGIVIGMLVMLSFIQLMIGQFLLCRPTIVFIYLSTL